MQSFQALQDYLRNQFENITGWCWKYTFQPLEFILQRQHDVGCLGPVAEIGVFRGRFFIGLALAKKAMAPHLAIDVFDMQQFSLAGDGSRIRVAKEDSDTQLNDFRLNLTQCGVDLDDVVILRADSTNLTGRAIESTTPGYRPFSLFSVDGCHEFTHAYNDINLAMELTDSAGVIFVDDYLHPRWPGVHEAMAKIMYHGGPRFVPLYYVYNKLVLCHVNYHRDYLDGLIEYYKKFHPRVPLRRVTQYGWQTLVIEPRNGFNVMIGLPDSDIIPKKVPND